MFLGMFLDVYDCSITEKKPRIDLKDSKINYIHFDCIKEKIISSVKNFGRFKARSRLLS